MTARELDSNGWYEIKSNPISKVGVFPYMGAMIDPSGEMGLDPDAIYMVYRSEEALSDPETIESFKLLPWTDGHEMLGDDSPYLTPAEEKGVGGVTGQDVYFADGTLWSNIKLFSQSLRDAIADGTRELSCGFRCKYELSSGVFGDQKYSVAQTKIRGNHLASVPEGRMGPDVAVLDHKNSIDRFTFTIDSKDIHFMPDEKDDKATDEESDYKKAMDAIAALDAKVSGLMASAADESDDDDKAEDMGDHDKAEDMDDDDDKAEDGEEDRDVTGSDEDDDDKDAAMDAAIEVKSLRRELKAHQRNGTRQVMREIRKRDALYDKVSPFVGAFDHADMDSQALAVYGCEKLGIKAPKGHEVSALDGYLTGRQRPTAAPAFGADAANKPAGDSPIAAHFNRS